MDTQTFVHEANPMRRRLHFLALFLLLLLPSLVRAQTPDFSGSYQTGLTLSGLIEHYNVTLLAVDKNNPMHKEVTFAKVADLKQSPKSRRIRDRLFLQGQQFPDREWSDIQEWAEPGKLAMMFHEGTDGLLCVGNCWFQCDHQLNESWNLKTIVSFAVPAYVGPVEKLRDHITAILAGKEVTITASLLNSEGTDHPIGDKSPLRRDWLHGKKGRVFRVKEGSQLEPLDGMPLENRPQFVGWGVGGPEVVPVLLKNLQHANPRVRAEAAADLGSLGVNGKAALPELRKAFRDADGYVRIYAAEAVVLIDPSATDALPPLVSMLDDKSDGPRLAAATALASMESPPRSAARALTRSLEYDKDEHVRAVAAFALGRMGLDIDHGIFRSPEVVKALAEALRDDPDKDVRLWSVHALMRFGIDAKSAIPSLGRALSDESSEVAELSAETLARFGSEVVPVFTEALASGNCNASYYVLSYLGEMRRNTALPVPILLGILSNPESSVRTWAALALWQLDKKVAVREALPVMISMLEEVNCEVLYVLAEIGPDAKPALPALLRLLEHDDGQNRLALIEVISSIGPGAAPAEIALRLLTADAQTSIRIAALRALGHIGRATEATAGLVKEVKNKQNSQQQRSIALLALSSVGVKARSAGAELRKAMQAERSPLRAQIGLTWWRVEQSEEAAGVKIDPRQEALDELIKLIDSDESIGVKHQAIWALQEIGAEARQAVPVLIRTLKDRHSTLEAAETLGIIGVDAYGAVPTLGPFLSDKNAEVRLCAATALCRICRPHAAALAELISQLEKDPSRLHKIDEVLIELGPAAKGATKSLARLLRGHDPNLYRTAARVLRAVNPAAAVEARVADFAQKERARTAR
jgi:HEAT repeat protein